MIEKGLKVTGVEPSPSMRKIANQKLANKAVIVDKIYNKSCSRLFNARPLEKDALLCIFLLT